MEHNEAIECLRQHVREFVELEVNARLDEYLHKMDRNGQLKFNGGTGASVPAPRRHHRDSGRGRRAGHLVIRATQAPAPS